MATASVPQQMQQFYQQAVEHHRAGRFDAAERLYRAVLAEVPDHAESIHLLGVLATQAGHGEAAVRLIRESLRLGLDSSEAHLNFANALMSIGQHEQAIIEYRRAIALNPRNAQAHNNLGNALSEINAVDDAIASFGQAIALEPGYANAYSNLGIALSDRGDLEGAVASYRQAISLAPRSPEGYCNLGNALRLMGKAPEAVAACQMAIELRPGYSQACNGLGNALHDCGRSSEAIAAYQQAIQFNPAYAQAYSNLGNVLCELGDLTQALASLRRAIEISPGYVSAYSNLSNVLKDLGHIDEAIAALRQALALQPDLPNVHSNLLLCLHYQELFDARVVAAAHREWNERHALRVKVAIPPPALGRQPDRRLRIGYVSADFQDHVVARYMLPLIEHHDRRQFEVTCYSASCKTDAVTERFQTVSDRWRSIVGLSDQKTADLIRDDQIDILVDLAGHTAGNRLLVFARKPAPIQVTYLGYPNTTGLTAIDYRLTDAIADPEPEAASLCSETLFRLPRSAWVYQPLHDSPDPRHPPDVPITFGCFNNFSKVTDAMLRLWAQILRQVPESKIVFKGKALAVAQVQRRISEVFESEHVADTRIECLQHQSTAFEHLACYNRVSIALDPFPYHGTTTTLDALWMGVPVITLKGSSHLSRVGASLLTSAGLPELIADNEEAYKDIAVQLANDRIRLQLLHRTLRQRFIQSPLMDAAGFARDIEFAFRSMWYRFCREN